MPRGSFSRGFPPRSRSKRLTSWEIGPEANDLGASANATVLWTNGIVGSQPVTIIRTRGMAHVYLTAATAIGDGFAGALGIGIVSADAFAVGASAIPDPKTTPEWDGWLWHSFFDIRITEPTVANLGFGPLSSVRIEIDSKAMRKFDSQSEILVGMLGAVESGTAVLEMQADTRTLVKV